MANYNEGDAVWVKGPNGTWWPGRIKSDGTISSNEYLVYVFFPEPSYEYVKIEDVIDFEEKNEEILGLTCSEELKNAMIKNENFLEFPPKKRRASVGFTHVTTRDSLSYQSEIRRPRRASIIAKEAFINSRNSEGNEVVLNKKRKKSPKNKIAAIEENNEDKSAVETIGDFSVEKGEGIGFSEPEIVTKILENITEVTVEKKDDEMSRVTCQVKPELIIEEDELSTQVKLELIAEEMDVVNKKVFNEDIGNETILENRSIPQISTETVFKINENLNVEDNQMTEEQKENSLDQKNLIQNTENNKTIVLDNPVEGNSGEIIADPDSDHKMPDKALN